VPEVVARFVIVGGGPAGVQAAATAARLGAEVTLVERDIVGGAANQWDCIPSKAVIATGAVMSLAGRARSMCCATLLRGSISSRCASGRSRSSAASRARSPHSSRARACGCSALPPAWRVGIWWRSTA
jgi:dihydrolipoamide dehydrogenase